MQVFNKNGLSEYLGFVDEEGEVQSWYVIYLKVGNVSGGLSINFGFWFGGFWVFVYQSLKQGVGMQWVKDWQIDVVCFENLKDKVRQGMEGE